MRTGAMQTHTHTHMYIHDSAFVQIIYISWQVFKTNTATHTCTFTVTLT